MSKKITEYKVGDKTYIIKYPTPHQLKEAQLVSIQAFKEAMGKNAPTRESVDEYMRQNNMWDDDKEAKFKGLVNKIAAGERQLARGGKDKDGKPFSKTQARELAIDIRKWRIEQLTLMLKKRELDSFTVQAIAENARFDFLVSECVFTADKKRVFKDMEDYTNQSTEDWVNGVAVEFSKLVYGIGSDIDKDNAENKFLVKYGFARDSDLHLINEKGQLVDEAGRLVNEDGKFINEAGEFVNINNEPVDENGKPKEEFTEFSE